MFGQASPISQWQFCLIGQAYSVICLPDAGESGARPLFLPNHSSLQHKDGVAAEIAHRSRIKLLCHGAATQQVSITASAYQREWYLRFSPFTSSFVLIG
jgi:hypothetical protein